MFTIAPVVRRLAPDPGKAGFEFVGFGSMHRFCHPPFEQFLHERETQDRSERVQALYGLRPPRRSCYVRSAIGDSG